MQEWQRQKGSKGRVFAVRPRPVPGLSLRGGCTPGNSRRVAARDKSRLWQLASLVLIERSAHVRGGCTPGNSRRVAARDKSRLGQLAVARAHREASARPRGLHPGQFAARGRAGQVAPVAARFARAHREASARPRRGRCAALPLPLGCVTEKAPFAGASPKKKKGLLRWQRAFRFTGERRGGTPSASSPPKRPRGARAGAGISPCGSRRPHSSAGPGDCWRGGPR